jgi:hypothetical protein
VAAPGRLPIGLLVISAACSVEALYLLSVVVGPVQELQDQIKIRFALVVASSGVATFPELHEVLPIAGCTGSG